MLQILKETTSEHMGLTPKTLPQEEDQHHMILTTIHEMRDLAATKD